MVKQIGVYGKIKKRTLKKIQSVKSDFNLYEKLLTIKTIL